MSGQNETFFTSVGCMDGRVQEPIEHFGQKLFGAEYPDTITEAGLVGLLSQELIDERLLQSIKKKILISLEKHHSKGIIVYGHQECAGNSVDDKKHREDIDKSAEVVRSLINSLVSVIGVFVKRSSKDSSKWEIEEV